MCDPGRAGGVTTSGDGDAKQVYDQSVTHRLGTERAKPASADCRRYNTLLRKLGAVFVGLLTQEARKQAKLSLFDYIYYKHVCAYL